MATPYRRSKSKSGRKSKRPHRDIKFRFHKNDQIGASDAETDREFLADCFVDTGDIDLLLDMEDHRRIVLGRTGTGKSALLNELASRRGRHVIEIHPETLALTYVSNSTILSFFSSIGVNLDPFFKLLWRHVFTVEVLRHHFQGHVSNERPGRSAIFRWLDSLLGNQPNDDTELRESIRYLKDWGESFWKETEFRVKEITQKFEEDLAGEVKAQLGHDIVHLSGSSVNARRISAEEKAEIQERAQRVVSRAQIEDLRRVIPLLDRVLEDRQKGFYLTIDGLDEDWVEEKLRYRLIMALIFTLKEMGRIKNVKAIVSLRRDLLERVFRLARDSGFQEEKYQSLYLLLKWDKEELLQILDKRVARLAHRRTGRPGIGFRKLMPRSIHRQDVGDYIVARAERPRDIIALFNACISAAVGEPKINANALKIAEGEYSRLRLRALADEWIGDYANLLEFTKILQKRPPSFKVSTIDPNNLVDLCLNLQCENPGGRGQLNNLARSVTDELVSADECRLRLVLIFYKVGLVGLKPNSFERESWVDELGRGLSTADVDEKTSVVVHPTYHRALGIRPR